MTAVSDPPADVILSRDEVLSSGEDGSGEDEDEDEEEDEDEVDEPKKSAKAKGKRKAAAPRKTPTDGAAPKVSTSAARG